MQALKTDPLAPDEARLMCRREKGCGISCRLPKRSSTDAHLLPTAQESRFALNPPTSQSKDRGRRRGTPRESLCPYSRFVI
jgi:hypothetical protein